MTSPEPTALATYELPVAQGGQPPSSVVCSPPSGQPFPIGNSVVQCTATDSAGQTASCTFTVSVSRLPTISKTRFLAFGDSVTVGVVATLNPAGDDYILRDVPNESYPAVLRQLLAGRSESQVVTVVNAGKGGERAVDAVARVAGEIRTHRPEVVLLLDGYNDLRVGEAGIGPGLAAVGELAKIARFQGAQVFIATLSPPNVQATRGLSNSLITRFNDGLRDIARGEGAVLVDLYQAMAGDANRYNSDDGLHPNEVGYRKMAETFFGVIRVELERR